MFKNPNPDNKPVSPEEKDKRKFTLSLVFIVVIGLSAITFILKFRQAKQEVKELVRQERQLENDTQEPDESNDREEDNSHRNQASREEETQGTKSKLVPAKRDRPTRNDSLPTIYNLGKKLEFRGDYQTLKGQQYLEIDNIKAFPSDMKDRFSDDEIVGEKNDRVYAFVKNGEDLEEASGVTYNTRTKRLGLITGTLKVRFMDRESFSERAQFIREPFYEKRSFVGINLSLLEASGDSQDTVGLEKLASEQSYWQSLEGVKSVEIEVLEEELTVK